MRTMFKINLNIAFLKKKNRRIPNCVRSSNLESRSPKFDKADSPQTHRETGSVTAGTSCPKTWEVSSWNQNSTTCVSARQSGRGKQANISGLVQGPLWQTTSCFMTEGLVRHPSTHCPNLMKSTRLHLHVSLYTVNSLGGGGCRGGLSACFLNSHLLSFKKNRKTFLMTQFSGLGFVLSPSSHYLLHKEF